MRPATFFENTALVAVLRVISHGRFFPHPEIVAGGSLPPTNLSEGQKDLGVNENGKEAEAPKQGGSPQPLDAVSGPQGNDASSEKEVEQEKYEFLVTWDGENDPQNPKNFSTFVKCWIAIEVGFDTHDMDSPG